MEVWLPYSDVEIPISLPDPIDLKLISRRFTSIEREKQMIKRLNEVLSGLEPIRICDSELMLPSEKSIISGKLRVLGLDHEFVKEDFNTVINLIRHDPIFGITCSYLHSMVSREGLSNLDSLKSICIESPLDRGNILFIDLLVDGLGRIQEIFVNDEWSFDKVRDTYIKYWGGYSDASPLVIAGLGGYPWDGDLYSILIGLSKALDLVSDNIVILVGDGELSDADIDFMIGVRKDIFLSMYLEYLRGKIESLSGRIYYFGSLPQKVCREFGLRFVKDVNRFIKTIPVKVKRETTVIEDVLHLYLAPSEEG